MNKNFKKYNVHAEEFIPKPPGVEKNKKSPEPLDYITNSKITQKQFEKNKDKFNEKNKPGLAGPGKDPKRFFSKTQGEEIWNKSKIHPEFDPNVFRIDAIGQIVSRCVLRKTTNEKAKRLLFDLEHIVSHSKNGRTIIGNGVLLNMSSNRVKGDTSLAEFKNKYEIAGYRHLYGVIPENLSHGLYLNLHQTCLDYNIHFMKNSNEEWTVDLDENYKTKDYNNQHEFPPCYEEHDFHNKEKQKEAPGLEKFIPPVLIGLGVGFLSKHLVMGACSVFNCVEAVIANDPDPLSKLRPNDHQYQTATDIGYVAGIVGGVAAAIL